MYRNRNQQVKNNNYQAQLDLEQQQHSKPEAQVKQELQQFKQQYAQETNKVLGKPNIPRNQQPAMKQLLQWEQSNQNLNSWDFKSQSKLQGSSPNKYHTKIERQQRVSEAQDQFVTLKQQQQQNYVDQIDYDTVNKVSTQHFYSPNKQSQPVYEPERFNSNNLYHNNMFNDASVYDRDYSQRMVNNNHQLRRAILENEFSHKGKKLQQKKTYGLELFRTHEQQQQQQQDNGQQQQRQEQIQIQDQQINDQQSQQNSDQLHQQEQLSDAIMQQQDDQQREMEESYQKQKLYNRQQPSQKTRSTNNKSQEFLESFIPVKAQENVQKDENSFKETFSRYDQTKTTLEQDKRLLADRKQVKYQETKKQWKKEDDLIKYDPDYMHQYVTPEELNPQNYDNPADLWVQRMPPAGKRQARNYYVYSVLQPDVEEYQQS